MHKTHNIYEDTALFFCFCFLGDSIDVRSSAHVCALLVFALGNIMHLPKEKHSVVMYVIW